MLTKKSNLLTICALVCKQMGKELYFKKLETSSESFVYKAAYITLEKI